MNCIRNGWILKPVGFAQWGWCIVHSAPSWIVNSGTLSRKEVAVPFRVEDLLAKFQNQIFSAISKAGDVKVLESRLVVLVVVTEDYFDQNLTLPMDSLWNLIPFLKMGIFMYFYEFVKLCYKIKMPKRDV